MIKILIVEKQAQSYAVFRLLRQRNKIITHNFTKLREMPREPLPQPHRKRVNVLIQLLYHRNSLNDWLILSVYIMTHLHPRKLMR